MAEIERNHIIGIVGYLGDGKTICGVSTVGLFQMLNDQLGIHRSILTNVPLSIDHELLDHYEQLEERKQTLIFIDEIHQNADSRKWQNQSNFLSVGVTMDVRKFKNKLFYTVQYANQVEKRIRQLTTLWIKPRQLHHLIFDLTLASNYNIDYDHVIVNLDPLKTLYDTHYKPMPLTSIHDDQYMQI
jgi:hypothetical protein